MYSARECWRDEGYKMEFEHTTNVVVVGSGAAGLTAAVAARDAGCEVIVLESMDKVGGPVPSREAVFDPEQSVYEGGRS